MKDLDKTNKLDTLKNDIKDFSEYTLNGYNREDYTTTNEGSELCKYIIKLVDYVKELEEKIETLQKNNFINLKGEIKYYDR